MSTKMAVVTGLNLRIVCAIVRGLCKSFTGVVYLTSHDEKLGREAIELLGKEGLKPKYHQLDITNSKSVEVFRDYIKQNYGGIDLLVNSAAIAFENDVPDPPAVQVEKILFVNYFSVVSICDILFPILRKGARVVIVSSSPGHLSKIPSEKLRQRFKDPSLTVEELSALMKQYIEATKKGTQAAEWGNSSYAVSNVGLTALTQIQQRLLADRDIKVNAVHPGYVDTDMTSHKGPLSIDGGEAASLFLALDAPDSVKGEYVWFTKEIVSWDGKLPAQ